MIRTAIAGCGTITRYRHAPEYAANSDCELAGFFDINTQRAQELVRLYGGKAYATFDELLGDKTLDAVSICTANATHAGLTVKALEAGLHVLCEKPMATSLAEALSMVEAAKKSGKSLMIGQNQRLAPAHMRAKRLIEAGEIGRVVSFSTVFAHSGPDAWSGDGSKTWFFKKDQAAFGSLADLGVHKLDLILWLLGDDVKDVYCAAETLDKRFDDGSPIEVDDNSYTVLRMKSGACGTLTTSWTNCGLEDNSTVIYGTEGVMEIYRGAEAQLRITYKNKEQATYKTGGVQTNNEQTNSGVIDSFIRGVVGGLEPEISGEDVLRGIRVLEAMHRSSLSGKRETV